RCKVHSKKDANTTMAATPMSNQTKVMEPTSHSSWKTAYPWARSSKSLAYPSVLDMADARGHVHVIVRDSRERLPQRCGTSSPRQTHIVFPQRKRGRAASPPAPAASELSVA